jgi:hypothetical protein
MEKSIVTFTLFNFDTLARRWWAFQQMGLGVRSLPQKVAGLRFCKLVGSGGGNGFSVKPNWRVYGLMCQWENEKSASDFFEQHDFFKKFANRSHENWTAWLQTTMSHGEWDGQNPFPVVTKFDETLPCAVLTRATIKTKFLWQFWKFVPRTSQSIFAVEGRLFSVGVGELPIVQQATFSLWENATQMMNYAYKSRFHSEVVKKTRELGWYSEELFARFYPYKETGTWQGKKFFA